MIQRLPAPLLAYRAATALLGPAAAPAWLKARVRQGKEDEARLSERYGIPGRERPGGEIVWAHGASIGETMALLPVVGALVRRGVKVLVTSGTVTSAELLARRLPPGARHQFLPLDVPRYLRRFLAHWRPRLAIFAESEIWPNTVLELDRAGIPLALVNGRISARSFAGWLRAPRVARALFGRLTVCVAQSRADAERLAELGATIATISGNLKFDLPPPPADPAAVEHLAALSAGREIWMAASTHPGEEEAVFATHAAVAARRRNLLTILAPRHPERGSEIAGAARNAGLGAARRSLGSGPDEAADIYLVDTLGELGLFYRLAPLVFVGGTLAARGGQNPFEPARLGTAILHGPHTENFSEIFAALDQGGGAIGIEDAAGLGRAVATLLADGALTRDMARAAADTAASLGGALERTMQALGPYLPPPADPREAFW
ncbi:3-deoxy-D-manno-octulosonic acid transferase [Enterovirga aerilata]|uniref:3-deoxy-D-manno-octulosonic acid transferase n=1 Tax=Enterovirga aerilata TaxID=2730920 RepID=A0A849IGB8_9HYPH|nr:3-deoxy-D-manno-octulosonic acid transferase [Enterovirga sp. DB1703]NNM72963.1 3-deoxy-D-manno-octulosonic acid transferase [Enterovirga sp. DB1703]